MFRDMMILKFPMLYFTHYNYAIAGFGDVHVYIYLANQNGDFSAMLQPILTVIATCA